MNTPDESIKSGWSAEISGRESWRDPGGTFPNWWEAGMALIEDEHRERWDEPTMTAEDTVPDYTEIDVGIFREPEPAENLIRGEQVIDLMRESDGYDYILEGCGCEDFLARVTKEQESNLTQYLRNGIRLWLTRWKLMPTWKVVGKRWTVTAGQIRAKAKEMAK